MKVASSPLFCGLPTVVLLLRTQKEGMQNTAFLRTKTYLSTFFTYQLHFFQ